MKSYEIIDRGIVFLDPNPDSAERVACYPSLVKLADGRIMCSYRVGSSKSGPDETVRISESRDGGATWERVASFRPETSLNGVTGSLTIGHLLEIEPGHLRMQCNWVDRTDPTLPISHPEFAGCLPIKVVAIESRDGGSTWSGIEEVQGSPFEQPEISGPAIKLSQPGHLLQPLENQKFYDDPKPIDEKCFAILSRDNGKTWPEWAMVVHDHPARKFWCNRIAKMPSGKLAHVSWTFDNAAQQDLPLHMTYGSADGLTWTEPVSTGIMGQVSALMPLSDDVLLMSTSHRESPAAIRLRTSLDGGATWDGDGFLVFDAEKQSSTSGGDLGSYYNAMTNYTFGWSPMILLDDGSILLVHFGGAEESIAIHWVKIGMSDND